MKSAKAPAEPVEVLCSFVAPDGRVLCWSTTTPPQDVVMSASPHARYVIGHRCRPDRVYYYRAKEGNA